MNSEIVVALLSLAGTLLGSLGGILTSSKLTNYRLSRLEEKVDRHNRFGERIPVLEERIGTLSRRIDALSRRIDALEGVTDR